MTGIAAGIPQFYIIVMADSIDVSIPLSQAMENRFSEGPGRGEGSVVVLTSNALGTGAPVMSTPVSGE